MEQREDAETTLTRLAAERQLHTAAHRVVALLDPEQGDTQPKDEAEQYDAPFLRLRLNPDGTLTLTGQLDKEAAAELTVAIDPLAKPRPTADSTGQPVRDQRSPDQRNADALMELVTGEAQPAQVVVTIGLDDLRAAPGTALAPSTSASRSRSPPCDGSPATRTSCLSSSGPTVRSSTSAATTASHQIRCGGPWRSGTEDALPPKIWARAAGQRPRPVGRTSDSPGTLPALGLCK